ncbi:hypothetical protein EAE69_20425 [Hafnia alvei ATCC 13337]|nr:hypothetical protein EAE69_20425 [Hafnia alvei ATCC 13337]
MGNYFYYIWCFFLFYTHYVVIFIRQVFISIDVEQSKSVNAGRMRYYRDCKIYILNKVLKIILTEL